MEVKTDDATYSVPDDSGITREQLERVARFIEPISRRLTREALGLSLAFGSPLEDIEVCVRGDQLGVRVKGCA